MAEPNVYGGGDIDRMVLRRLDEGWLAEALLHADARLLLGWRDRLAVVDALDGPRLAPLPARAFAALEGRVTVLLGEHAGAVHFAVDTGDLDEAAATALVPEGARLAELREVGSTLPAAEAALAAAARGVLQWHRAQRFCGRCGAPTTPAEAGHVLVCTNAACATVHHPRIEPAAIVLVTDGGDRCLLGARTGGQNAVHSCFAGFVEPGESLEGAAAREVFEEVGVRLAEVRYHSSQPWPFPGQLMVGFIATASTFEVHVDETEIKSARWFTRAELLAQVADDTVRLPRADSVSHRMISDWMRSST
ncbi:MAG: NAD(+) diphosphatase [Dehalococcoidia bacterium]|nr:NAD(+) diphosphatase [Dehalococcoidia bacterium]